MNVESKTRELECSVCRVFVTTFITAAFPSLSRSAGSRLILSMRARRRLAPISPHLTLVLRQSARESMPAIGIRDEIQKIGTGRLEGGLQGGAPRIRYRPRRQSAVHISIIRRGAPKIAGIDVAAIGAIQESRVNHRGIALQGH